jgi:hypothetical protein
VEWKDVTSDYAGLFFRAEGGGSAAFGSIQNENSPRLSQISRIKDGPTNKGLDQLNITISPGSWTNVKLTVMVSNDDWRSWDIYVPDGEVRPRNQAIRVWKRIKYRNDSIEVNSLKNILNLILLILTTY